MFEPDFLATSTHFMKKFQNMQHILPDIYLCNILSKIYLNINNNARRVLIYVLSIGKIDCSRNFQMLS